MPRSRRALLGIAGSGLTFGSIGCTALLRRVDDLGVAAAESECPTDDVVDRVVCTRAGRTGVPPETALRVVTDESTRRGRAFRFRLRNRTGEPGLYNPCAWFVHKRVDGRWHRIFPGGVEQPADELGLGDAIEWVLDVDFHGRVSTVHGPGGCTRWGTSLAGLGGGEYAVSTDVSFGDVDVRFANRFALDAAELTLEPFAWPMDVRRDGSTIVVDVDPPWGGRTLERRLERTNATADVEIIAEQAVRNWMYRQSLPFFEDGVERVVLRAPRASSSVDAVQRVVRYRGTNYRITESG